MEPQLISSHQLKREHDLKTATYLVMVQEEGEVNPGTPQS